MLRGLSRAPARGTKEIRIKRLKSHDSDSKEQDITGADQVGRVGKTVGPYLPPRLAAAGAEHRPPRHGAIALSAMLHHGAVRYRTCPSPVTTHL